jgi:hypothetical protein
MKYQVISKFCPTVRKGDFITKHSDEPIDMCLALLRRVSSRVENTIKNQGIGLCSQEEAVLLAKDLILKFPEGYIEILNDDLEVVHTEFGIKWMVKDKMEKAFNSKQ